MNHQLINTNEDQLLMVIFAQLGQTCQQTSLQSHPLLYSPYCTLLHWISKLQVKSSFRLLNDFTVFYFRIESKANLLWIPSDSDYNTNELWLENNFEIDTRDELILFEAENVLTPTSLMKVSINSIV